MQEKTRKNIADGMVILDEYKAAERKSNEVVAFCKQITRWHATGLAHSPPITLNRRHKKTFDRTKVFHEFDFFGFRLGYRMELFVVIQGWDLIDDAKVTASKNPYCHF